MVLRGERLDRPTYEIIQTLTEGNTSFCYHAHHEIFEVDVVEKTVSLLGLDDALAYTEPRLLKGLKHPHLTEVWEAQWDPDPQLKHVKAITFVMPFYSGQSVAKALIEGYRFSVGAAIGIACGVLDALYYLHVDRTLLHRDVKPGNVFLDADRRHPYLGDLGSAAVMTAEGDTSLRGGTLLYRPPESTFGRYTVQGDLYGVGFLLLECLNGPLPYANLDQEKIEDRLHKGKRAVSDSLLKPGPHVTPRIARIVNQLLARDPSKRPASALSAQRSLQRVQHMDWCERSEGQERVWDGSWPPAARPNRGRMYEIRASPVPGGPYSGQWRLSARWRQKNTLIWRNLKSLERRVAPYDTNALSAFFREVETAVAQNSAAR